MMIRHTTLALALLAGCSGTFGGVTRSVRVSDSARVTATSLVPDDASHRGIVEHLAIAQEIYNKTLDELRDRRASLRSRSRALSMTSYATFAATTLIIGGAAILKNDSSNAMTSESGLSTAGLSALGGLGLGTGLQLANYLQEDPANVDAKVRHLQSSYDTMVDRIRALFEANENAPPPAGEIEAKKAKRALEIQVNPIIETFINEAVQINIKG